MSARRLAVLSVAAPAAASGGAERLFTGLVGALRDEGHEVELVEGISDESSFEGIQRSYLGFYDMDLSRFDGVVSTKAPTYAVRHPNHVCYLMHTMRVFYDMFPVERPQPTELDYAQRDYIHRLDRLCMSPERVRRICVIGEEVRQRLHDSLGLDGPVLRHPSNMSGLAPQSAGSTAGAPPFFLCAGRLHRWKRVDLAIRAMRMLREDARLIITGVGEDEGWFRELAAGDDRIVFLGRVDEATLKELYATALAVMFTPVREDLGLVTLEAFSCARPVITAEDSGEPARIVENGRNGFVAAPDPASIAEAMRRLVLDPRLAAELGQRGLETARSITWQTVARGLISALEPGFRQIDEGRG